MVEQLKNSDLVKWLGTSLIGVLLFVYMTDRQATKEWRGDLKEWRDQMDVRMYEMDKRLSKQEDLAAAHGAASNELTNKQLQAILDHIRVLGTTQPNSNNK